MSKDSDDCNIMNELFDSGSNNDELPHYHWHKVAEYNDDGTKIRNLTKEEQILWIKEQKLKEKSK